MILLLVCGCPPAEKNAAPRGCTVAGAQCEYAPGKLGGCVQNMDGGLVCQSQH